MNAQIYRVSGDEITTIWTGESIRDEATQQAAVAAFLDADNCPPGTYLVANARLEQHGEGWITVAMMEWRSDTRTVVIHDLGAEDVTVAATDPEVVATIAARIAALIGGTANLLPGSTYRTTNR